MSFSYNADNPDLSSSLAQVRLRIGDTDINDPYLQDEEVEHVLSATSGVTHACVKCVEIILAKIARKASRSVGGVSTQLREVTENYRDLLKDLKAEARLHVRPLATGQSAARQTAIEQDSDYPQAAFKVGQDDL